jgi:hypothetical protein
MHCWHGFNTHNNRDRQSCLGGPYVEQLTQGMGWTGYVSCLQPLVSHLAQLLVCPIPLIKLYFGVTYLQSGFSSVSIFEDHCHGNNADS